MEGPTSSPATHATLPQYGFGSEFAFNALVEHNPFIFRVYTPKARSPFYDSSEPFFVGQKFNEAHNSDPQPLLNTHESMAPIPAYRDVEIHMDWTTRSSSPFISTSFSVVWSIWEALRRYHTNVKHDIEIAVIDARAVSGHAFTALELLRQAKPNERHRNYWKWYRFAVESQDVLVYGSIPGNAVLASIPLISILEKLPSFFSDQQQDDKTSILDKVRWHSVTQRKPSYREFCQDVSERFLSMSTELRLRDTTAQSVRMAVTLLRPWFHKTVHHDFSLATSKVSELALSISRWSGQWWARDHAELWDIISHTVLVVGEEIRQQQDVQISKEMQELRDTAIQLEKRIEQMQLHASESESPRDPFPEQFSDATSVAETVTAVPDTPEAEIIKELPIVEDPPPDIMKKFIELEETYPKPIEIPDILPSPGDEAARKTISILETMVTGFLFGAFITLCLLSTQRRTLANHLT